MDILIGKRQYGKTAHLIRRSADEWVYILTSNYTRASEIFNMAKNMNLDEYLEEFKNKAYDNLDNYWHMVFNSKDTYAHFIASINGHIYDFCENEFINLNRISINYAISLDELAQNCNFSLSYNEAGKLVCLNIDEDMIDLLVAFQTVNSETVDKLAKTKVLKNGYKINISDSYE